MRRVQRFIVREYPIEWVILWGWVYRPNTYRGKEYSHG